VHDVNNVIAHVMCWW